MARILELYLHITPRLDVGLECIGVDGVVQRRKVERIGISVGRYRLDDASVTVWESVVILYSIR